jgi:dTDP-4-amino-4,6-dideoxygalactose transaminase
MKVSFVDFAREWNFFEKKFLAAFKKFGQSGMYVLGPEVEKFEHEFATFSGYKYGVGMSTGLSALEVALRAYNIGPGDEVVTVANTAVATVLAISSVGATPVFCDVGTDFLIDPAHIEALITKKTKAILPVHLFGKICDMKSINRIAKKYHLTVIEDACQAHGSTFAGESKKNTKAVSFYPTKNLGTLGEGGLLLTNDVKVRDFALSYRNYGQQGRYNHVIRGTNYRLEPLHAVLLRVKLPYLGKSIEKRRRIAKKYIEKLKDIEGLGILTFDPTSSYHLFVVRVFGGKRGALQQALHAQGIDTLIHYPTAVHRQPCYREEYKGVVLKNTDQFEEEILSLPCHPFMTDKEVGEVIRQVKIFYMNT